MVDIEMNDYEVSAWLKRTVDGERYWDLVDGDSDCGSILALSSTGFVARVTGSWDDDKKQFADGEPYEAFYPWATVVKVAPK